MGPRLDHIPALAAATHADQRDRAGAPYTGHLARVAAHTARLGGDPVAVAAAWLHDTIEDGLLTAAELTAAAVPDDVIDVVDIVTRRDGETYTAFIDRIATTPDPTLRRRAVTVKRADLADNTDPARLALLEPATAVSLTRRYRAATERLDRADVT